MTPSNPHADPNQHTSSVKLIPHTNQQQERKNNMDLSMKYVDGYVDAQYGTKFVETLFEKNWLIPGVTFTNEYQLDRGGLYVFHKQNASNTNLPEDVGADYDMKDYANTEISLSLLNQYSESLKIPNATVAATSASVLENTYRVQAGQIAT
jgi:hypothetical protein